MWLTLAVGAIGFGACSRYIAMSHQFSLNTPKLISDCSIALALWGIGMVIGGLAAGWLADKTSIKLL